MRKRRTREHVIADLSVNHFERFVFRCGHVADRSFFDYGYDLSVRTFDSNGEIEIEVFFLQLKASDSPKYSTNRDYISFTISDRDAAFWRSEPMPVILVIYDASREAAFWTHFQNTSITASGTIRISTAQIVNEAAIEEMRRLKNLAALGVQNNGSQN